MKTIVNIYENIYDGFFSLIEKYYLVFFIILSSFIAFLCFYNLGNFPIMDWDEARHGVSAYEMLKNNEFIINTYNYQNDYWNLKPILSFWPIILSFKLFGVSIFSFRFFSAFSLLLTAILLALFIVKKYGRLEGLISLASFSVCGSFYLGHFGRHGDADAFFMLLFTIAMLSMLLIDEYKFALYTCGLFFALAFLTKSWHAFAIVAIGGLYLLFTGELFKLKLKQWIIFILSFIIPLGAWIIARIIKDGPEFLIEMVRYDLLQRSSEAIEGHTGDIWYYFDYLFSNNKLLVIFMLVMIVAGVSYYSNSYFKRKNDVIGFALWIIIPFAIFTKAETKLFWYIIPTLVPLVAVSSIFFGRFIKEKSIPVLLRTSLILIFAFCIAYYGLFMIRFVRNVEMDTFQSFMFQETIENDEIKSKDAYIELDSNVWSQSRLLTAEMTGDFKCKDGGIESFLKDANSLLVINKENYDKFKSELSDMIIMENNDEFYILSH